MRPWNMIERSATLTRVIKESAKGHVERFPSDSFRVAVFAGRHPVTGKEIYLEETVRRGTRPCSGPARLPAAVSSGRTGVAKRRLWSDPHLGHAVMSAITTAPSC